MLIAEDTHSVELRAELSQGGMHFNERNERDAGVVVIRHRPCE